MADEQKKDEAKSENTAAKSKLPDMKEIGAMASKLFGDIKKSICDIVEEYKQKHPEPKAEEPAKTTEAEGKSKKAEKTATAEDKKDA